MKIAAGILGLVMLTGFSDPPADQKDVVERLEKIRAEEKAEAKAKAEAAAAAARIRAKERDAIIGVIRSLEEIVQRDVRKIKNGRMATDVPRLIADLDRMNLAGCPQKFRLAWHDLVTALKIQDKHHQDAEIDGLFTIGTALVFPPAAAGMALKTAEDLQAEIKSDPEIAARAIGRILIEYDLDQPPK